MPDRDTQVLVIGAGPAGLTAALYAARAGMQVTVCERAIPGGTAATTDRIENYPGFPGGINGAELAMHMQEQARASGAAFITGDVGGISPVTGGFVADVDRGQMRCLAVVVATGSTPRRLEVPGEAGFIGRGVSFCATCDGPLYRGKVVAVVGGGDAAAEEALFLARFADRVIVIHRRDRLRAVKVLADRLVAEPRVEIVWNTVVSEVVGDEILKGLKLTRTDTGETGELEVDGMFTYIGADPNSGLVSSLVDVDDRNYIITDARMQTSIPGVFAAGDVRATPLRQVATAVGDGAIAGTSAERYVDAGVA